MWKRSHSDVQLAAIEAVYRERFAGFVRLAQAITGEEQSALDAVHDGFVRAVRYRRGLRDRESAAGWICRIVINEARRSRKDATRGQPDIDRSRAAAAGRGRRSRPRRARGASGAPAARALPALLRRPGLRRHRRGARHLARHGLRDPARRALEPADAAEGGHPMRGVARTRGAALRGPGGPTGMTSSKRPVPRRGAGGPGCCGRSPGWAWSRWSPSSPGPSAAPRRPRSTERSRPPATVTSCTSCSRATSRRRSSTSGPASAPRCAPATTCGSTRRPASARPRRSRAPSSGTSRRRRGHPRAPARDLHEPRRRLPRGPALRQGEGRR